MPKHDEYAENTHLCSPSPETKPEVNPSEPPHTPKKAASKKKTTASPSAKTSLIGSPSKDKAREMKRIALDALFEMGVRGEAANSIAAQVSPCKITNTQVRYTASGTDGRISPERVAVRFRADSPQSKWATSSGLIDKTCV
jgi:hypothetical protein